MTNKVLINYSIIKGEKMLNKQSIKKLVESIEYIQVLSKKQIKF